MMVNAKALLFPAFQYFLDGHVCEPTEIAASNNMSSARRDHDYYNRESHLRRGIAEKRTIHFIESLNRQRTVYDMCGRLGHKRRTAEKQNVKNVIKKSHTSRVW